VKIYRLASKPYEEWAAATEKPYSFWDPDRSLNNDRAFEWDQRATHYPEAFGDVIQYEGEVGDEDLMTDLPIELRLLAQFGDEDGDRGVTTDDLITAIKAAGKKGAIFKEDVDYDLPEILLLSEYLPKLTKLGDRRSRALLKQALALSNGPSI
jgi:hypothetical protein